MLSELDRPFDFDLLFAGYPNLLALQQRVEAATREQFGGVLVSTTPLLVATDSGEVVVGRYEPNLGVSHCSCVDAQESVLWYELRRIAHGVLTRKYSDQTLQQIDSECAPLLVCVDSMLSCFDQMCAKSFDERNRLN